MKIKTATELFQVFPAPYLIVGLGKSGLAAQRLLLLLGATPKDIFTLDEKSPADFNEPGAGMSSSKARTLIVSPGYPLKQNWVQEAIKSGVIISSELSLASYCLSEEKLIGITGSVGKSTVCALLGAGFAGLHEEAIVCGNFGLPLASYVADVIEKKISPQKWLVIELSSYQLENCAGLSLYLSAVVSLTANHLERYSTKFHYYATKLNIFNITISYRLCGTDSSGLFSFLDEIAQGLHQAPLLECGTSNIDHCLSQMLLADLTENFADDIKLHLPKGQIYFDFQTSAQLSLPEVKNQRLVGLHNVTNILLCMAIFRVLKFSNNADSHLLTYGGLPHRLENLGERNHILFINDSKATTLESVTTAAETMQQSYPDRRAWLLIGGKDKNLPWQDLARLDSNRNLKFLFFGDCAARAKSLSCLDGEIFPKMSLCLEHLKGKIQSHDVVLLSPGGTSFDEFKSFEERGQVFKAWVNQNFPP